jgi:hypothetical protein
MRQLHDHWRCLATENPVIPASCSNLETMNSETADLAAFQFIALIGRFCGMASDQNRANFPFQASMLMSPKRRRWAKCPIRYWLTTDSMCLTLKLRIFSRDNSVDQPRRFASSR